MKLRPSTKVSLFVFATYGLFWTAAFCAVSKTTGPFESIMVFLAFILAWVVTMFCLSN